MPVSCFCWGKALDGFVPREKSPTIETPTRVSIDLDKEGGADLSSSGLKSRKARQACWLACGAGAAVVGKDDGTVVVWGSDHAQQLGSLVSPTGRNQQTVLPSPGYGLEDLGLLVRAASVGERHALFLTDAQHVVVTGSGMGSQCAEKDSMTPLPYVGSLMDTPITQVACGSDFSLFLSDSGAVFGAGANDDGQLGNGSLKNSSACKKVQGLPEGSAEFVAAACGGTHSMVVCREGVYAFGNANRGRLGLGPKMKKKVTTPRKIEPTFFSAPLGNRAGVDGGDGGGGGGGNGGSASPFGTTTPKHNITAIALGAEFSLFLTASGEIWACGDNSHGQMATGMKSKHPRLSPAPIVEGIEGVGGFIRIAAGHHHCAAVSVSGQLYTWGAGRFGSLGHGTASDEYVPKLVSSLSKDMSVVDVSCGKDSTAVLVDNLSMLARDILALRRTGDFVDCSIVSTLDGASFPAHQVLLTRCPNWRDQLLEMKAGDSSDFIIKTRAPAFCIDNFLTFLYSDCLPEFPSIDAARDMRALADEAGLVICTKWCDGNLEGKNMSDFRLENETLASHLRGQLLDDHRASDFKATNGGISTLSLHRAIISARANYFAKIFESGFRESHDRSIDVGDEISSLTLRTVFEFLYTNNPLVLDACPESAVEVLMLSIRWNFSDLQHLCEEFLEGHLDPDNCLGALELADAVCCKVLRQAALAFAGKHLSALPQISDDRVESVLDPVAVAEKKLSSLPPHLIKAVLDIAFPDRGKQRHVEANSASRAYKDILGDDSDDSTYWDEYEEFGIEPESELSWLNRHSQEEIESGYIKIRGGQGAVRECPVCSLGTFSPERLHLHVAACLDGRGSEIPPDFEATSDGDESS